MFINTLRKFINKDTYSNHYVLKLINNDKPITINLTALQLTNNQCEQTIKHYINKYNTFLHNQNTIFISLTKVQGIVETGEIYGE